MGDAGNAAHAIVEYLEAGKAHQGYIAGWDLVDILPAKGSKNIPLLRAAADLIRASYTNDKAMLAKEEVAWIGYCSGGLCHGEDISTIYLRWIAMPILVAHRVFLHHGRVKGADSTRKWLRSLCAILALSAGGSKSFKNSKHSKHPGQASGVSPITAIVGARSWCSAKRNGSRRTNGVANNLQWIDGQPMSEWLEWALQMRGPNKVGGGDGWTGDVLRGLEKRFPASHFLTNEEVLDLRQTLSGVFYAATSVASMIQHLPRATGNATLTIVRRTNGGFSFWDKSFHDGSTPFAHAKVFRNGWMEVHSTADPTKRTNSHAAVSNWNRDSDTLVLIPDNGESWSWDQNKMVPGNVQVPLPGGAPLWVVTVGPTGVRVEGASVPPGPPPIPDEPDEPGEPDMKDDVLDRIVDLIVKYLEESGIIDRIIEKLFEKLLGKLGA
jgi:hypothetical protein